MLGVEWSNDPDHSSHAGAGRDRAGRWKKRDRFLSPALPRKTSRRPILRLCGYFSQPQWNRHSPSHLRWARILACAKTTLQGVFSLVAEADQPAKKLEAYEAQLLLAAGDVSRVRAAPMWKRVDGPN